MASARWLVVLLMAVSATTATAAAGRKQHERWRMGGEVGGHVVERERRRVVAEAEAGTVTAVDVADAAGAVYRLHFIAMDPGALFLPVQLHADMVFYVHSGRGKVTYIEEESNEQSSLEIERGDVYNFNQGSIVYIQSYPNATRQRLRINAILTSEGISADDPWKPKVEAYSSISNLVKGFKTEVLRHGFGVRREIAEAVKSAKTPPSIIPYNPQEKGDDEDKSNWSEDIVDALLGVRDPEEFLNKKKKDKHKHKRKDKKSKSKAFNFYSGKPDVQNCYGWSKTMTNKDLDALHGSNIGMFMVNLTTGSMMAPHWNPKATEIAIVTDGSGIVQTVCPSSNPSDKGKKREDERRGPGGRGDEEGQGQGGARCRNSVFRVKEGDVFVVPRFHPMAHMSFNNDSFVFVGFSTHMGQNHPQFLAGKGSVLQAIGKEVLALSLGQENSTAVEKLLSAQRDSTILSCISCAEALEEKAAEEVEKRREEEEGGGKGPGEREEEEKRREREEMERREREEEERRREQEERERREREEMERREREEEERRREQEEREKREEEERQRKKEEERERRKEEERARREEERQREEEERRREEEEEERRREEEEGGGGRGDEPEREEEEDEPPYSLSKKLQKRYRAGGTLIRNG